MHPPQATASFWPPAGLDEDDEFALAEPSFKCRTCRHWVAIHSTRFCAACFAELAAKVDEVAEQESLFRP